MLSVLVAITEHVAPMCKETNNQEVGHSTFFPRSKVCPPRNPPADLVEVVIIWRAARVSLHVAILAETLTTKRMTFRSTSYNPE